jgi:aspartate kinase
MNKLIVSKFGGTSMQDATAMNRSGQLSLKQGAKMVVVSATAGTTNHLINLAALAKSGDWTSCEKHLNELILRHKSIGGDLKIETTLIVEMQSLFDELTTLLKGISLLKDCSIKTLDSVVSFGERISSVLMTQAIKNQTKVPVHLFDVRKILRTDDFFGKGAPQIDDIEKLCAQHLPKIKKQDDIYITQGFIGETHDGHTTTLGRGGSDYSAALIAEGLNADVLEIWTDVAGIATTDPRLCKNAKSIPEMSYQEASELAIFGAKVLHPTTVAPVVRKNIPLFVGSSINPELGGTWVRPTTTDAPLVRAMAIRKDQSLMTISNPRMLMAHGFLYNIFKVFNDYKISADSITTSEISVAITVDDQVLSNKTFLTALAEMGELKIEENLSVVSLIGNRIHHTPKLAADIFTALGDINVRMICLGASMHNFCFLVAEDRASDAILRLHEKFIK